MQYFVPSDNRWIEKLKHWLSNDKAIATFRQLEATCLDGKGKPSAPCSVFFEVSFPWARPSQADLVLAFDKTVVVCEVKTRSSKNVIANLGAFARDLSNFSDKLQFRLQKSHNGFDPSLILYLQTLNRDEINLVNQNLRASGHQHLIAAGDTDGDSFQFDLASVISRRPGTEANRTGVREAIHNLLSQPLLEFKNINEVIEFIAEPLPGLDELRPASWYVESVHRVEYDALVRACKTGRVVEVIGDPGVGKSEVIKKYVRDSSLECYPVTISNARTLDAALQKVFRGVMGSDPSGMGSSQLLARLDNVSALVWIETYDVASRAAVGSLLNKLVEAGPRAPAHHACWLLEGLTSANIGGVPSIVISRCSSSETTEVLERLPMSKVPLDIGAIVAVAEGNIGFAIAMARAPHEQVTPATPNQFQWFVQQFSNRDKTLLQFLCFFGSLTPLGSTLTMFSSAARHALNTAPTDTDIRELCERLRQFNVLELHYFDGQALDPSQDAELFGALPAITFIGQMNSHFSDYVNSSLSEQTKHHWRERLETELSEHSAKTFDLADVTFALLQGHLWPFFRSAFRSTNTLRDSVLDWIAGQPTLVLDQRDRYLFAALQEFSRLAAPEIVDHQLPAPIPNVPETAFAYLIIEGRSRGKTRGVKVDVASWLEWANTVDDVDLRAELTLRLFERLESEGRYSELWALMRPQLDARANLSKGTRGLLLWHVGAFLNRRKQVEKAGLNYLDASAHLRALLPEMIQISIEVESLRGLANALFYYARDVEYLASRGRAEEPDAALRTLAALEFVERSSSSRRVQALLTQGSVHRHMCREQVPWESFKRHMNQALMVYRRAYGSATFEERATHRLNAVSYMGDVWRLGLKHYEHTGCAKTLASTGREILAFHDVVLATTRLETLGLEDKPKLENVKYIATLITFVSYAFGPQESERDRLAAEFGSTIDARLEMSFRLKEPWGKKTEKLKSVMLDLERALLVVNSLITGQNPSDPPTHYSAAFESALARTLSVSNADKSGTILRAWRRLQRAFVLVFGEPSPGRT